MGWALARTAYALRQDVGGTSLALTPAYSMVRSDGPFIASASPTATGPPFPAPPAMRRPAGGRIPAAGTPASVRPGAPVEPPAEPSTDPGAF